MAEKSTATTTAETSGGPVSGLYFGNGLRWKTHVIPRSDFERMLADEPGVNYSPPIPALSGVSLRLRRLQRGQDNQATTYLMAGPPHGFAPMEFQRDVGPCLVARADGKDYSSNDHDAMQPRLDLLLA